MVGGTEDLWKGYRQNHTVLERQPLGVVTCRKPDGVRVYVQMHGLIFGLASAVNQFNRMPQLIVATVRRSM